MDSGLRTHHRSDSHYPPPRDTTSSSFNGIWTNKFSTVGGAADFCMPHETFLTTLSPNTSSSTGLNTLHSSPLQYNSSSANHSKSFDSQLSHDTNNNSPSHKHHTTDSYSFLALKSKVCDPDAHPRFSYPSADRSDFSLSLSDSRNSVNISPMIVHSPSIKRNLHSPGNDVSLLDDQGAESVTSRVSECVVCGDKSSGKHYGQYTCEGCKSFFKRSVRRELSYSCRGSRVCRVDMQHRNQCQYCRYQKCLKMGMRKEAVQRGRMPSGSLNSYVNLTPYNGGNTMSSVNSSSSWHDMYNCHSPLATNGHSNTAPPRSHHIPPLLTMIVKAENHVTIPSSENIGDHSCQILLSIVEWARRIPHFLELNLSDSVTLLTNSWHELFLLNILQFGLTNSLSNLPLNANLFLDSVQTRLVQDQLERFSKTNLDRVEFACLKCLVLFNPDSVGLSEVGLVESIQERIQIALEEHVRLSYPSQINRLSKLLLRLPAFRAFPPQFIEQLFFSRQLSSGKGFVETLIRDILLGYSAQFPPSIYNTTHPGSASIINSQISPIMNHSGQHVWSSTYPPSQSHPGES